jgi:sulfoxide reductase heme-binding subunit YedZ
LDTLTQIRLVWKPLVFLACLVPFALVAGDLFGVTGSLGANPVEEMLDRFGNWGLRFVMITLAVTPLRQLSGWNWLARFRRMLGLFTFFYVLMHFLTWLVLDQGLLLSAVAEDIVKRPFITIGVLALVLLIALAVTSTSGMRRRLGRRWQSLHNAIYLIAILGVWHFWWQVKLDTAEPLVYAIILGLLLGWRAWKRKGQFTYLAVRPNK